MCSLKKIRNTAAIVLVTVMSLNMGVYWVKAYDENGLINSLQVFTDEETDNPYYVDISLDTVFTDLDKNNPYYESIVNLAELEIIKGYSDGTVRPNRYITLAEVITLIQRGVNGQRNLDWDWFRNRAYMVTEDKFSSYNLLFLGILPWWPNLELVKPGSDVDMTKMYVTVGDVVNMILGAYKLSSIRPMLYGINHREFSSVASFIARGYRYDKIANDIVNTDIEMQNVDIQDMQFIRRKGTAIGEFDFQADLSEDSYDIINAIEDQIATRGEVCDLLYWAIRTQLDKNRELEFDETVKHNVIEPIVLGGDIYTCSIEDQRVYQELCYNTLQLTDSLREIYVTFGGKLSYLDSISWELVGNPVQAVGKFSYDDLSITISNSNRALYHEFGHFLQLIGDGTFDRVQDAFENKVEFNEFMELNTIGHDYGQTTPEEFFAESFSVYMTNREYFSEKCPVYYSIITDALDSLDYVLNEYREAGNSIILHTPKGFDLSIQNGEAFKIYAQKVVEE